MQKYLTFNLKFAIAFAVLFGIELCIALYVQDKIVRPYIGDILVVILIYFFLRIWVKKYIQWLPIYVFLFAILVEIGQAIHIVQRLHITNQALSTSIGNSFDWVDMLCYFVGACILLFCQKIFHKKKNSLILL